MSILQRYLLKELFYFLAILTLIFTAILLAKETYETRDEILDEEPAVADVLQYVVLGVAADLADSVPLLSMFAVLFAVGFMAKNREILAMVAAGVPFSYLAWPVALFGLLLSALSFWFGEYVAPGAAARARYLFEVRIKGENQFAYTSNDEIFRKGEAGRFYVMASFDSLQKLMVRPSILDLDPKGGGLARRIEADSARYDPQQGLWNFEGAQIWTFDPQGRLQRVEKFDVPVGIELEPELDDFLGGETRPEEMNAAELRNLCQFLRRQGTSAQLPACLTSVQSKISLPFSCLLLALLGFTIAADLQTRRFVLAFSIGLLFGLAYFVLRESSIGLGRSAALPPIAAAWAPPAIFGLVVLGLFRRLVRVH